MSNIDIIKELQDSKKLKPLIVAGLFPAKVLTYVEMYHHVDAQVKTGVKKKHAVCMTAACFNVHPKTVTRALDSLK